MFDRDHPRANRSTFVFLTRSVCACASLLIGAGCQTTAPPKRAKTPPHRAPVEIPKANAPRQKPSAEAYRAVLESDLLLEAGDNKGAKERIEEAILADPYSAFLKTRLGEMRLNSGDIEGAADAAVKAIALSERSVPALRLLARARALQADRDEAVTLLKRALSIAPGDRDASTELAAIYLKEADVEAAEAVIEALMTREPNATDGYVTLAQLFAERGQTTQARRHVDAALERDARDLGALELARALAEAEGDFGSALKLANRTVRERGDSRGSRHLLLRGLLLAGEKEEAATLVTSWLTADDSDDMLLLVADAMERAGDRAAARTLLRDRRPHQAPAEKTASPRVMAERGRLAYADHAFDLAATLLCDAADELDSEWRAFSMSLCLRSLAFAKKRPLAIARARSELKAANPSLRILSAAMELAKLSDDESFRQEVLASYERDFSVQAASEDKLESYVEALEALKTPRDARSVIDDAIRQRPRAPALKMLLARHLERQGDAIAAVAIVESQFDLVPPTQNQLNFVAFTLADNALRPKDAVDYAWRALVRAPTSGYLLDTLGWAQFQLGDVDGALTHLKRADRMSPNEAEILLHLSQAALAKAQRREASQYAQDALRAALPGDPIRERIEAHLLALDEEPA